MRSVLDWLSEFYGPKRNPFLRLSEPERVKLGVRATLLLLWLPLSLPHGVYCAET